MHYFSTLAALLVASTTVLPGDQFSVLRAPPRCANDSPPSSTSSSIFRGSPCARLPAQVQSCAERVMAKLQDLGKRKPFAAGSSLLDKAALKVEPHYKLHLQREFRYCRNHFKNNDLTYPCLAQFYFIFLMLLPFRSPDCIHI